MVKTIFYVEDTSEWQERAIREARREGWEIVICGNTLEAIRKFPKVKDAIDIIVLDIGIDRGSVSKGPNLTGPDLAIKFYKETNLPIIFYTENSTPVAEMISEKLHIPIFMKNGPDGISFSEAVERSSRHISRDREV